METNNRLRDIRKQLNISQKDFSLAIGVRQSYYSDVENGKKKVTSRIIQAVRDKFNISSEWLYTGNGDSIITNGGIESTPENVHPMYTSEPWNRGMFREMYPVGLPSMKGFNQYALYRMLPDSELDFLQSVEFQSFKESYQDFEKLTKFLHSLNPPEMLMDKFKICPDFNTYNTKSEEEFNETHTYVKNEKDLKVLKIIDLYQSNKEHFQSAISKLIEYMYQYSDLISAYNTRYRVSNGAKDA
jgi:transcriptional regulator with XRE-family HTH domain